MSKDMFHDAAGCTERSNDTTRRRLLAAAGTVGTAAIAGCFGDETGEETDDEPSPDPDDGDDETAEEDGEATTVAPELPQVEDPPEAVYVPTHFEAMRHLEPVPAGEYELVPMVTYPHQFWNVTGTEVEPATVADRDDVHLMVTVRDPETGAILPVDTGLELAVGPEGGDKSTYAPWPMISQEMGFHVGNNVPLGEDGTYEAEVRVGAIDARKTGEFEGRFEEPGRGSFTFEYDEEFRQEVVGGVVYLDDEHWGRRGALENHVAGGHHDHGDHDDDHGGHDDDHDDHEEVNVGHDREQWDAEERGNRYGTYPRGPDHGELPPANELPGTVQGTPVSGDAVFATTILDRGSRFVEGEAYYLAVSPRTPYNRSILPMMSLSYALEADGDTASEGSLVETLDHELGYHYGASIEDLEAGQTLAIEIESPPQVSRHAGYERAFVEMPPVSIEVTPP